MPITLPVRGQERGDRSLPIRPGFKNLLMLCLSRRLHWHTHGRTDRFHRILIAKPSAVPIFCKLTLVRVTNTSGMRFYWSRRPKVTVRELAWRAWLVGPDARGALTPSVARQA